AEERGGRDPFSAALDESLCRAPLGAVSREASPLDGEPDIALEDLRLLAVEVYGVIGGGEETEFFGKRSHDAAAELQRGPVDLGDDRIAVEADRLIGREIVPEIGLQVGLYPPYAGLEIALQPQAQPAGYHIV